MIIVPHEVRMAASPKEDNTDENGYRLFRFKAVRSYTLEAVIAHTINSYYRWLATGKPESPSYWKNYKYKLNPVEGEGENFEYDFINDFEDNYIDDEWVKGVATVIHNKVVVMSKTTYFKPGEE